MTSRAAHWVARQVEMRRIEHLHAHGAAVATEVVVTAEAAAVDDYDSSLRRAAVLADFHQWPAALRLKRRIGL